MNYCTTCKRYLNGAFSCAGCGASADRLEERAVPAPHVTEQLPGPVETTSPVTLIDLGPTTSVALDAEAAVAVPARAGILAQQQGNPVEGTIEQDSAHQPPKRRPRGIVVAAITVPIVVVAVLLAATVGSPSSKNQPPSGAQAGLASPRRGTTIPVDSVTLPAQSPAPTVNTADASTAPPISATAPQRATAPVVSATPRHHPTGRPTESWSPRPSPDPTKTACFLFICN